MSDSDPRQMPVEIQRAYRDPIDLRGLLRSEESVYSEKDRGEALDALMRSLLEKHGDVWIVSGSKEIRVSTRIKQMKKNAVGAIELLSSIEEYGGSDGVLPLLAQAMQPRWAQRWRSFSWSEERDVERWAYTMARHVLGQRQFVWLSAQYARTVIDRTKKHRMVALRSIEAAETWALVPSEENRLAAEKANTAANAAGDEIFLDNRPGPIDAIYAAGQASEAAYIHGSTNTVESFYDVAVYAANSTAYATAAPRGADEETFEGLAALTKRLITPTLVTSASRGLRPRR